MGMITWATPLQLLSKGLVGHQQSHGLPQVVLSLGVQEAKCAHLQINIAATSTRQPFRKELFSPHGALARVFNNRMPSIHLLPQNDLVDEAQEDPLSGPQSPQLLWVVVEIGKATPKSAWWGHPHQAWSMCVDGLQDLFLGLLASEVITKLQVSGPQHSILLVSKSTGDGATASKDLQAPRAGRSLIGLITFHRS